MGKFIIYYDNVCIKKKFFHDSYDSVASVQDIDGATTDQSKLLRVAWARIVLDEAHSIKNHKSLTALSICRLRARSRWALTGTPIQNDLLDMYSLLRLVHVCHWLFPAHQVMPLL